MKEKGKNDYHQRNFNYKIKIENCLLKEYHLLFIVTYDWIDLTLKGLLI